MADLQYSEDEQAERVKAWWKENGTSVIAGAVVGIAVIVGVNYWRGYKTDQSHAASTIFQQLQEEQENVETLGQSLISEYANTPYSGKAALILAKLAVEKNDINMAKQHLRWATDNAPDPADQHVARIRLGKLMLYTDDLQAVGQLLKDVEFGGYESQYRELLGDLALARNDPETARDEYQDALANLPRGSSYAAMLNMKLDAAIGAIQ